MPLDGFKMGDDCPICGHKTDTGSHALEPVPGHATPFLACPSYTEFFLGNEVIVCDALGRFPRSPLSAPWRVDPGENDLTKDGHWRPTFGGAVIGHVQVDECWRCDATPVHLAPDPLCPDGIGVCGSCLTARVAIAAARQ